jgi:hypothetical protein
VEQENGKLGLMRKRVEEHKIGSCRNHLACKSEVEAETMPARSGTSRCMVLVEKSVWVARVAQSGSKET